MAEDAERTAIEGELQALAATADSEVDIGETALKLAALDRPHISLERYRAHLAEIAADLLATGATSLDDQVTALHEVIVTRHGYEGDRLTYDDVQNANLIRVIDRKKGLPVSLGILFIHAGQTAGWNVVGMTFPFHFLVRVEAGGARASLDPFEGGAPISADGMRNILKRFGEDGPVKPEFYQVASNREVLMRLENNIKSRAMQARDFPRAAAIIRRMLLFAPGYASLWRELCLIETTAGNLRGAVAAAEEYARRAKNPGQRHDAATLLQRLKKSLN